MTMPQVQSNSASLTELQDSPQNVKSSPAINLPWYSTWWGRAILLALWVLLMKLSFPWTNYWFLSYVALVPLAWVAISPGRGWRLAAVGYVFGFLWWLWAFYWLWNVTFGGWLALAALYACWIPAIFWVLRSIRRLKPAPMTLLLPLVYVTGEFIRGDLMGELAVPMYLLGQSQPTIMIQIADFSGVYGVSAMLAMCAGALIDLLLAFGSRSTRPHGLITGVCAMLLSAGVVSGVYFYGHYRLEETDRVLQGSDYLRIGVVQTDIPQDVKNRSTDQQREQRIIDAWELTKRLKKGHDLAGKPLDLVVWPETVVAYPINEDSVQVSPVFESKRDRFYLWVNQLGSPMLIGGHSYYWEEVPGELYPVWHERKNTAFLFEPQELRIQSYDKYHRVPFGEFLPFTERFPILMEWMHALTPYQRKYTLTPGDEIKAAVTLNAHGKTWKVGTPICFEDIVGHVARNMIYADGQKQGDLLVNLTNDGWFPLTSQPWHHEQIARFRCVENRVPMARSVNRGVSGHIDSAGRVVNRLQNEKGEFQNMSFAESHPLNRDPRSTFYGKKGELFASVLSVICAVLFALSLLLSVGKWLISRGSGPMAPEVASVETAEKS